MNNTLTDQTTLSFQYLDKIFYRFLLSKRSIRFDVGLESSSIAQFCYEETELTILNNFDASQYMIVDDSHQGYFLHI